MSAGRKKRGKRSGSKPPAPPGYRLRDRLGAGAVGEVWRARGTDSLEREFAIKIFPAASAWERELASLRQVEALRAEAGSRDLVETFLADEVEGRGYVIMEYLAGGDLWQRVRTDGPLDAAAAVEVLVPVARALALLHAQGLVHKDVKPNNVLLGSEGAPRLADFGLARAVEAPLSQAGTPGFCAPEVYSGDDAQTTPRLDVYSLGATLHCLLTGQAPLPGRPDLFELERHDVDRGLQELLIELLRPDPAQRPPDGAAVLERLVAWTPGAPARASASSVPPQAVLIGLLLVALLAGAGFALNNTGAPAPNPTLDPGLAPASPESSPESSPVASPETATPEPGPETSPAPSSTPTPTPPPPLSPPLSPRWDGRELRAAGPPLRWRGGEAILPNDHTYACLDTEPVTLGRDPSGRLVAAATALAQTVVLRIKDGQLHSALALPALEIKPLVVRVALREATLARLLVFAEGADRVELWDLGTRRRRRDLDVPPAAALALASDDRVVLGGLDGRLHVHDGARVVTRGRSHRDSVFALSVSAQGQLFVLGDDRALSEGTLSPAQLLRVRTYDLQALLAGELERLTDTALADWEP